VEVTVSIGVAVSRSDAVDTDDLTARADAALYAAKAGGRDTVRVDVEPR
jgi:diguanylate cyclase (GGDEF)-like protein